MTPDDPSAFGERELDLSASHYRMLSIESGLPHDIIVERGYFTASKSAEIERLGFSRSQAIAPALVIPVYGVTGERVNYQLRPDRPRISDNGRVAKYEHPKGSHMMLDVLRRCLPKLGDPNKPLYITEGAKKGDALAAKGLCAIALSGVWNWRGRNDFGGKAALPDWDSVALNERLAYIVFDSDVARKAAVAGAMDRLKSFLEMRGATVRIVYLPDLENGSKQGVDDFLVRGGTVEQLHECVSDTVIFPDRYDDPTWKPEIRVTGRALPDIADDVWDAIARQNEQAPTLFERDGQLVLVRDAKQGCPRVQIADEDHLAHFVNRTARFVRQQRGHPDGYLPVDIPRAVLKDMLAEPAPPVPMLRGLVEHPVVTADGSLLTTSGYDDQSRLYICVGDSRLDDLPDIPTVGDVRAALIFVREDWLGDFPFCGESSFANVLAALLTPLVRESFTGSVPLIAIEAPSPGTGKSLLVRAIAYALTGRAVGVLTESSGDEERKRITSMLSEGRSMILMDNVQGRIDSPNLAAALTAEEWTDRLLGSNKTVTVPNRALWIVTGNNLEFNDELARRAIVVRLDAGTERPADRSGFRHPDLIGWTAENRGQILASLITLVRFWIASGRPEWRGRPLGSFESWSAVIGGILQDAGVVGFLGDRDHIYRVSDAENDEWGAFVECWGDRNGTTPVKIATLDTLVLENDLLQSALAADSRADHGRRIMLGKAIGSRRGRVYGSWRIADPIMDRHSKTWLYRLEAAGEARSSGSNPAGDVGVSDTMAGFAEFAGMNFVLDVESVVADPLLHTVATQEAPGAIPHNPQNPHEVDVLACATSLLADSVVARQPVCSGCGLAMTRERYGELCTYCYSRDG